MTKPIEKIGRVSNASVLKCTKKSWAQWVDILNRAGCKTWPHGEITKLLKTKYKLSAWWQQGVAIGYETYIGVRVEGQNSKGLYSTVATKTFKIDGKDFWKIFSSQKGLEIWLKPFSDFKLKVGSKFEVYGGVFGEVRTIRPGSRIRMTWQETDWAKPTVIQIYFLKRPKGKAAVAIVHEGLTSSALRLKMRDHWKKALRDLAEFIS